MKKTMVLLSLILILVLPNSSYALLGLVSMDAAVGGGSLTPSGTLDYQGDELDLEKQLGFDSEVFSTIRVRLELPLVIPNIYLSALQMDSEDRLRGQAITFGGESFDAGASTKLTYNQYDAAFFYGIPGIGLATLGKLNVDLGINIRVLDVETEITQALVSESRKETLPLPMLFVAAQFEPLEILAVEAEIRALSIPDANLVSAIGRIRYNSLGPLFLTAGYRYEAIDVDTDDLDLDIDISGPFAEIGMGF